MTMALDGCSLSAFFFEEFFFAVEDDGAEAGEENKWTGLFDLTKASAVGHGSASSTIHPSYRKVVLIAAVYANVAIVPLCLEM